MVHSDMRHFFCDVISLFLLYHKVQKISMPMHASIKPMVNVPQYVAIMYVPILLGMKTGTEDMRSLIADDSRFGQYAGGKKLPLNTAPILLPKHLNDIARDLKPISGCHHIIVLEINYTKKRFALCLVRSVSFRMY